MGWMDTTCPKSAGVRTIYVCQHDCMWPPRVHITCCLSKWHWVELMKCLFPFFFRGAMLSWVPQDICSLKYIHCREKRCRGENKKLGLQSVWSNFKVCKLGLLGLLSFLCQQFLLRSWDVAPSKGRFLLLMKKGIPFPKVPHGPCALDWDMLELDHSDTGLT